MANVYKTNFVVSGNESATTEQIVFENPSGSGKLARMYTPLSVIADQGFMIWEIKRYTSLPTHGTGGNAPTAQTIYKMDSSIPAAACEVYVGDASASFSSFSGMTVDWLDTVSLDGSDAGDDMERIPSKYLPEGHAMVVRPGECMTITVPAGLIDYTIVIIFEEEAVA